MISPLLQTKLHIPPVRSEVVPRPRLIDIVETHSRYKLALISAPAGFGKTTLASAWLAQTGKSVAWVSLDEGENDPHRFLLYVLTALHQASRAVGGAALELLLSPDPVSPRALLAHLINDLASAGGSLILALDDYHRIHTQEVHDALAFLLDNLPPQLQIVLISRAEPPLPLARLRAQGELVELSAGDLRFTRSETEAFLNQSMRLGLSPGQIAELERRTEGWITALQLVALTIRNAEDAGRLIRNLSGDDRYIADYLVDEVLSHQPAPIQRFLLRSSILGRMSAELCDAVLEIHDSRQVLERLERSNLFVVPLDNTRTWYRYHHLFAELLYRRYMAQSPDDFEALHRRAARWLLGRQMIEEAIEHALCAREYAVVTEYLHTVVGDEMLAQGRFSAYLEWLDRIPDEHLVAYPKLILYRVFQLWEMQQLDKFRRQLALVERMLGPVPEDGAGLDAQTASYYGILCVIKGVVNCGDFAVDKAAPHFSRALQLLPEEPTFWRTLSVGATGFCHRVRGNYAEAERHFAQVVDFATESGLVFLSFMYGIARSQVGLAGGDLETAMRACRLPLSLDAEQGYQLPFAGVAYTMMGEMLYLSGALAEAEEHVRRGLELVSQDGDARHIADSYFSLARIRIARGDRPAALAAVEQMIAALAALCAPQSAQVMARAYRAHIWTACNRLDLAAEWAAHPGDDLLSGNQLSDIAGLPYFGVYCTVYESYEESVKFIRLTAARYALAAGRPRAALEQADALLERYVRAEDVYLKAQLLIVKALAHRKAGEAAQAVEALLAAVRLLAPQPYLLLFTTEGEAARELLEQARLALARRAAPGDAPLRSFVDLLLSHMQQPSLRPVQAQPAAPALSPFALSPRELDVLTELAKGVSYTEITESLLISRNTVKTYLKRIYSKLEVNNRLQAVNRAKELGLLPGE